jgi:putative membrane protein
VSGFLRHWIVIAASLGITAWILPGVHIDNLAALLVAAIVMGFLNAVIKPIVALLTLPVTILTLGLFYLVLNGIFFALAATLVPGFEVVGLGSAVLGWLVMSIFSWFLGSMLQSPSYGVEMRDR